MFYKKSVKYTWVLKNDRNKFIGIWIYKYVTWLYMVLLYIFGI